ncbi:MAG: 3-beta hydroxysteroid dehydrogenase [Hyphomicrobiales bacterium]|nr:3-beta hydroxysteroid dehydrogenase [Hyphomicrobiales bacterium]MDB5595052.1 3-beta hydroxysteroid dehydrogenase [Hyphomicrobiales bacterium]
MTETLNPSGRMATVFGGAGFLGRHVVAALAKRGWRVRVACRRPDLAGHLQPLGRVGQIQAMQANLRYPASVAAAVDGAEAVVNLVGVLTEGGRQRFDAVHAFGAGVVARAARNAGAQTLVQVSAIGADADSPSAYARSKAAGEQAVRDAFPEAIIVRPSLLFGPEDDFFNRFAAMARLSPVLPLIGGGGTRFQPVYAGDVAEAIARALEGHGKAGETYEFGGPDVKTFRELMEYICQQTGRRKWLAPIPTPVANVLALGSEIASALSLGLMPAMMLITRDQVKLLQKDNVVSPAAQAEGRTLEAFGVTPDAFETIAPGYLYRYRKTGQFGVASAPADTSAAP